MLQKKLKKSTNQNFSICKNCEQSYTGIFCNHCGQKSIKGKLGLAEISSGVTDSFNFEKGFFRTIKELLHKPHLLVENYLNGKRKTYFNPIKYYIVAITINVFFAGIFQSGSKAAIDLMNSPIWLIINLVLLIPLLSAFTTLFSKKYNYLENIVVNLYVLGTTIFLSTFFLLVFEALAFFKIENPNLQELFFYGIRIGYLTWVYSKLFRKKILWSFIFSFFAYFSVFLMLYVVVKQWFTQVIS